jgi:hypothetical protein
LLEVDKGMGSIESNGGWRRSMMDMKLPRSLRKIGRGLSYCRKREG